MHEHLIQGGFLVPGAGLAMVVGPDRIKVLRGVGANALDDLRPGEIGLILDSGHEVHQIPSRHRNLDWVRANLRRLGDGETLLRLLLQGLDHDLSERSRKWSIDLAEPMLTSGAAADFASRRLLGCPVPEDADLDGGSRLARSANCSRVVALYADMVRLRPALADLHDAWKATCANQTPDFPGQALRRQLIDAGIFERCARSLMARDRLAISTLPLDATLLASLIGAVQQPAKFLVGFSNMLIGKLSDKGNSVPIDSVEKEKNKDSERDDDPIISLIQNGVEEASLSQRETPRTYSGDLIEKIENQKKNIVKEFARGREERAWRFVRELVEYQLANSRPEHLAKSLCDIAARLNGGFFADAALRIYCYAREANYNEYFPLVGRAEVLKAMGRLGEALAAYEDAVAQFPNDVVPRNGRAEALKAMGRLGEALAAYEDAVAQFPNDVVARNGRAEALKAMGRLGEALAAYEDGVAQFPNDVVARNGRAEVLKAMGRLGEALAAYEDAVAQFPNDVVARNGRAEVLKAMGRLGEALAAYEDAVAQFPNDVVARNGRAEVLKAMGRLGEALAAYEDVVAQFPNDVVARTGRAEVLKAMGQLGEALAAYSDVLAAFPRQEFARNGKASTLVSIGRTQEVIEDFKAIQPITRGDWISCHILAMAYLRSEAPEEARHLLEMGAESCPFPDCHWYFAMTLAYLDVAHGFSGQAAQRLRPAMAGSPTAATVILFSHALAASGNKRDAATSLDRLGSSHVPAQVLSLKDALTKRYGLRGHGELPKAQREALDKQIAEGEFALLLEAA
ncbi:tetratricopeptide repeat protein [Aerophototrophica crusticola]|uniref:Tetratricopeptide repeat protein n=1 Tax=Aerophototrophica crusticola TaxID=1709002 RepID=A0A858R4D1_9PROT|nr:tetratricopeptide repeat protein [Rhodospirillaceae bacterium B3]